MTTKQMRLTDMTVSRLHGTDYVFTNLSRGVYRLYKASDVNDVRFVGFFPTYDAMWRHAKAAFDE